MATLIFIVLRLTHVIVLPETQSEVLAICQLLAIDTVSAAIIFHALLTRRSKRA